MKPNNILLSALLASALTANAQVKINVDVANPGVKVSPNLYGIFFEDINHAATAAFTPSLSATALSRTATTPPPHGAQRLQTEQPSLRNSSARLCSTTPRARLFR